MQICRYADTKLNFSGLAKTLLAVEFSLKIFYSTLAPLVQMTDKKVPLQHIQDE